VVADVGQPFSGVELAARAAKPPDSFVLLRKSGTTGLLKSVGLSRSFAASAKLNVLLVVDPKMFVGAGEAAALKLLFDVAPKRFAPNTGVDENPPPNGLISPFSFAPPKTDPSPAPNEKFVFDPKSPPLNGSAGFPPNGVVVVVSVDAGVVLSEDEKIELLGGVASGFAAEKLPGVPAAAPKMFPGVELPKMLVG
jgi:hypothetical protein